MKSKKVLTILLSLAIMLTFMPTMAFATDDPVSGLQFLVSGGTQYYTDFDTAVTNVSNNGTIFASGTAEAKVVLDIENVNKNFKVDFAGAELQKGLELTAKRNNSCLEKNADGTVYSYLARHNFVDASAISSGAATADVILTCENGETLVVSNVSGTRSSSLSTDETNVYQINATGRYTVNTAVNRVNGQIASALVNGISWSVAVSEDQATYHLLNNTVDYVKDDTGLAVRDENGKVQFFANYALDGTSTAVLGDDGEPVKLVGTYDASKDITDVTPATTTTRGTATYSVSFAVPGQTDPTVYPKSGVVDTEKKAVVKNRIVGIQFQYVTEEEKTFWGVTLPVSNAQIADSATDNSVPSLGTGKIVLSDSGALTFRYVWSANEGTQEFYDEAAQLAPLANGSSGSTIRSCGYANYKYSADALTKRYEDARGNIVTFTMTFDPDHCTVENRAQDKHTYSNVTTWAANWNVQTITHEDHPSVPTPTVCSICGQSYTVVVPGDDKHSYEAATGTTPVTDPSAAKVYTESATCLAKGFSYYKCLISDGKWEHEDGTSVWTYTLKSGKETLKVWTVDSAAKANWHPVLIDGSIKDKVPHKYYVINETGYPIWDFDKADDESTRTAELHQRCVLETGANSKTYKYHQMSYDDFKAAGIANTIDPETMTDSNGVIHVFDAISPTLTQGADCTKKNTILYTINGVTKSDDSPITNTYESSKYGPHTYDSSVTFSADGKTATVLQKCKKACGNHLDVNGNKNTQTKDAVVTATENADGSTTYTATLEGVELTNNTKTVFDLTKAVVTVNEGEEVDLNTLGSTNTEKDAAFAKLVKVTINGAELDSELYSINPAGRSLAKGINNITISGAVSNVVGTAKGVAKCIQPKQFGNTTVGIKDGGEDKAFANPYTKPYDTKAVEVAVTKVYVNGSTSTVVDANVKYAVTTDPNADPSKLEYDADKVEVTEAGTYYVYAQLSKEEYTTVTRLIDTVTITPVAIDVYIDNFSMKQGETPTFNMSIVASGTSQVVDVDKSQLTITSVGGMALEKLLPGDYRLLVTSKNYNVTTKFSEDDRVGTVTVLTKEGKTADQDAADTAKAADYALADANAVKASKYTAASYAKVTEASKALKAAILNGSLDDIKTATADLNNAIDNLKVKKTNTMKVTTKKVKATYGKTVTGKVGLKVKKAKGTKSFKKANKSGGSKIVVNKKTGKFTVKKGLKKGTYKVKVQVKAAGNGTYKAKTVTKTVKVVVK
jgi:hypothetical protein